MCQLTVFVESHFLPALYPDWLFCHCVRTVLVKRCQRERRFVPGLGVDQGDVRDVNGCLDLNLGGLCGVFGLRANVFCDLSLGLPVETQSVKGSDDEFLCL